MTHTVDKGIIYAEKGIPETPRWFSDSRLTFQMDENSITQVDYRNPLQSRGNHTIFLQRLWDGFRYFLERKQVVYRLDHNQSKIWPFGLESQCEFEGSLLKHQMFAVADSIVIQLITPADLPADLKFELEFYKDYGLVPVDSQDPRFGSGGAVRTWQEWEFDAANSILLTSMEDHFKEREPEHEEEDIRTLNLERNEEQTAPLHIGISADFPLSYVKRPLNPKYILMSDEMLLPNTCYSFVITFDTNKQNLLVKMKDLTSNLKPLIANQFKRYQSVADQSPVLISPYKELNDFISLVPMYHESCKVTDTPGAIKAKNANYWVWGWDGMTSNYASLYWGDQSFIQEMLQFYENTADPELGIGHSFGHNMSLNSISELPSQSMYISLLQQYYTITGDLQEVKDRYPFAKRIFKLIKTREVQGTGFCESTSLFPDYPLYMKETGHDISGLNNTIFYCAARSMEYLADLAGDLEMMLEAKTTFTNIEKNFLPLFFDKEKKFIVSSIDSETLQQRNSFNSNAVKWENSYCGELMEAISADCLSFFEENIVCKAGLREIPTWSEAYDADANQLHCWWPVTGEYYMRLINGNNRGDLIKQWVGWVSYWTKKLTCPEGISCYIDTDEPDIDRWNTAKGMWHAYSMRGFYQAAIHGVVGVDMEAGGLTFYPYAGEEMTLQGLHFRNKLVDIEMKGSGPYIQSIIIDGQTLLATNKLPVDLMGGEKHVSISVNRVAENQFPISIQTAYGMDLLNYRYEDGIISADVQGSGTSRLKLIAAGRKPIVTKNGISVEVDYDSTTGKATVELELSVGQLDVLEIRGGNLNGAKNKSNHLE
ncbi:hypothetical protein EHS13_08970 [Paenibacillus psychroresistens]|uniref:Alpha-L-rhamnosidase six-hairpin glycosidase domain-containing protein n=1 Tax=Paenibacillus psychroresistens TaxID=1778678 RepID=A0A6B8RI02_9BACL|nr:hypothetical protein [Paenibacillus psychroresistens]QGQ95006.1 hypothetical protein EHS13_08970 [Paenibacillus psychroresistens]